MVSTSQVVPEYGGIRYFIKHPISGQEKVTIGYFTSKRFRVDKKFLKNG